MNTPSQDKKGSKKIPIPIFGKRIIRIFQRLRQRYLVFLFFVVLSTLLWFSVMLGESTVGYIYYPIRYTNLPHNKILSQAPPDKLRLQVRADGLSILYNKIKFKRPLSYNVSAFQLYSLSLDSLSVYTLTRYALDSLTYELNRKNSNLQILDISPDTLTFNFASVKKRRLPVAVRIQYSPDLFKRQYMLNGRPYSVPDTVVVTGPASVVDTLKYVYTTPLNLTNLSDTIEKKAVLEEINRVEIKPAKTKVFIPVDEFTEAEITIPVNQVNVPDSLNLKTFPDRVTIKYQVTMSNYERVSADLFNVFVDFTDHETKANSKLEIRHDPLPSYLHNIKLSHRNVEYLIEKNSAENRSDGRDR